MRALELLEGESEEAAAADAAMATAEVGGHAERSQLFLRTHRFSIKNSCQITARYLRFLFLM